MNTTKKLVLSGLFVALGVILPVLCHGIPNAGSVLMPMHIPVLLCGLSAAGSTGWPADCWPPCFPA